jgi:serine/threonine-protein kinase
MSDALGRLRAALEGRYRIERELGQGGMATVYLAEDLKHDRYVALKVLKPELAAVLGADRFVIEIKTTAALQHPHILPLFDSGTADGFLFYVMPFIDGETLRAKLDRETQLGVEEAVRIATDVADALDYAHQHGVIHRDIKPENVLLANGRPMVADFGIALAVSAAAGGRMTETGLSLGTPHYMSPEQATADKEITARSDVYSLASVLYEMLAGEPPHSGTTAQQIIMKIIAEDAQSVTSRRKSVPPNVAAALAKALEKLPADRFESAKAFAGALANPSFVAVGSGSAMATRVGGLAGRWRWAAVVLAAVALVASALAVAGWLRTPPKPVVRVSVAFPEGQRIRAVAARRFALSRDGARLVYIGPEGDGTQLWLRDLSSLTARPVSGTGGAVTALISPDGRSIAFCTALPGDLRVVPAAGGPSLTLVRDSVSSFGDWGADGAIYFTDTRSRISRVPAGGGAVEVLSDSSAQEYLFPQLLPGGHAALIQIWTATTVDSRIGVLEFATGRVSPLLDAVYARYLPTGHIASVTFDGVLQVVPFDPGRRVLTGGPMAIAEGVQVDPNGFSAQFEVADNGTLIYLVGGGAADDRLVWVDRQGRKTPADSTWHGSFRSLALSPDGTRITASVGSRSGEELWVKSAPGRPPVRLTSGTGQGSRPSWSPDGRSIAFLSAAAGNARQAFIQQSDGSRPAEPLVSDPLQIGEIELAPDGRHYLFRVSSSGTFSRDIRLGTIGDTAQRLLAGAKADEYDPAVSPDSRWFAYTSNETGREEVFVRSVADPGGGRFQVSLAGGNEPRWAPNGRELFYRTAHNEMMSVTVTLGDRFTSGTPVVLFRDRNLAADNYHHAYDVSPDGRRFLMIERTADDGANLIMVFNWFEELRRMGKR